MTACIAHRGYAARYAENTLPAVRAAAETADAVEVDVRRCADDAVVCHDPTVDRVTDATGPLADYTAAELADLSVLDSGAGVPRLAAVVAAVPADVGLNLEVKERDALGAVLDAAREADNAVLVSAFDAGTLRAAREAAPEVPRAYLFGETPTANVERAAALDCAAAHPSVGLCLRSRVVGRAHRADLCVNAWTVRSRPVAWLLARVGVDGVVADRPVGREGGCANRGVF